MEREEDSFDPHNLRWLTFPNHVLSCIYLFVEPSHHFIRHVSFLLYDYGGFCCLCLLLPQSRSRGHYPFVIALRKYADRPNEPITKSRVREFVTSDGSSKPGMYRFLREQSSGAVDLEGSIVGGWYKTAQIFASTASYTRQQRLNSCRDAAVKGGIVIPSVRHVSTFLDVPC